mmetsp:Transcript_8851/g.20962  ORF Transcript_8851/g.20962 Transcript_8851/m.20962 type:complete len:288 (-) Transcript_8851:167-1030(-)
MGEFRSGSKVRVHGLQNKIELNGMCGTCLEFKECRWHVRLTQIDEVKAILPANLEMADMPEQTSMCHVFLDSSRSMSGVRLQRAKQVLRDVFPRFVLTPTAIHLIGNKKAPFQSRCLFSHTAQLENREAEVMNAWTAKAGRTFLWEYVYQQVRDFAELNHEVILITDGDDNGSSGDFVGLNGFNEFMTRMSGKRMRISLFLIGNSLAAEHASAYRDLCLATGGVYSHSSDSGEYAMTLQEFVAPLLLTEAERDILAQHQQAEYLHMLDNGDANAFEWFSPVPAGSLY